MCVDGIGVYNDRYEWLAALPFRGQLSFSTFEFASLHGAFGRLRSGAVAMFMHPVLYHGEYMMCPLLTLGV